MAAFFRLCVKCTLTPWYVHAIINASDVEPIPENPISYAALWLGGRLLLVYMEQEGDALCRLPPNSFRL